MDFFEKISKKKFFGLLFPVGIVWSIFCSFFLMNRVGGYFVCQIIMIVGLIAITFGCYQFAKKK